MIYKNNFLKITFKKYIRKLKYISILTDHPAYPTWCPQKLNYQWTRILASDLLKILSLQSVDVNLDVSNKAAIRILIAATHRPRKIVLVTSLSPNLLPGNHTLLNR